MKNYIFIAIPFIIIFLIFSSCKLQSIIPTTEFAKQDILMNLNGTYLLPEEKTDSLSIKYLSMRYRENSFKVDHLVKENNRELLKSSKFEKIKIFFDGKNKITFTLFDKNEKLEFTYKCKMKDDFLEIYFKKTRIFALPLFMKYEYDRLRLGLNDDSNLIIHKWETLFATLTIMPFDSFREIDYREEFPRLED